MEIGSSWQSQISFSRLVRVMNFQPENQELDSVSAFVPGGFEGEDGGPMVYVDTISRQYGKSPCGETLRVCEHTMVM